MNAWVFLGIKKKILACVLALVGIFICISTVATVLLLNNSLVQGLHVQNRGVGILLATALKMPTEFEDVPGAEQALDGLKDIGSLSQAAVITGTGAELKLFARAKTNKDPSVDLLPLAKEIMGKGGAIKAPVTLKTGSYVLGGFPIPSESGKVSFLLLATNLDSIHSARNQAALLTFLVAILLAGLGVLASWAMGEAIVNPINSLTDHLRDISEGQGDLTGRLESAGTDEIAQQARHFNHFVADIQALVAQVVTIAAHLASGAIQMNAGMAEMASSADAIAQANEQQKGRVAQATMKVNLIAGSSKDTLRTVSEALKVFDQTQEAAVLGGKAVDEAIQGMRAINDNSKQIGNILTVITEIANQTNLLSLNAAIEAAKAGEQGKGFAVVAEEVRKLAERCAAAAKEITTLIGTSGRTIADGSGMVNTAGTVLKDIQQAISASAESLKAIGTQSQTQSSDSSAVSEAMNGLSGIADQNAAATEQVAATLRESSRTLAEFTRLADQLNTLVARFTV